MIFVGSDRSSLCYVHCTMHIVLYCTLLCTANCSEGILPYENGAFGTKLIYWGGKCWNGRLNFAFTMISDQWWFCPAMYVEKSYVSWESIWFLFCGYTLHNKIQLHHVLRFCAAWDLVLYWSWSRILHNQILLHYVGRPCVVLAEIYFVLSFYIDRSQIQFLRALFEHASSNYTFDLSCICIDRKNTICFHEHFWYVILKVQVYLPYTRIGHNHTTSFHE